MAHSLARPPKHSIGPERAGPATLGAAVFAGRGSHRWRPRRGGGGLSYSADDSGSASLTAPAHLACTSSLPLEEVAASLRLRPAHSISLRNPFSPITPALPGYVFEEQGKRPHLGPIRGRLSAACVPINCRFTPKARMRRHLQSLGGNEPSSQAPPDVNQLPSANRLAFPSKEAEDGA